MSLANTSDGKVALGMLTSSRLTFRRKRDEGVSCSDSRIMPSGAPDSPQSKRTGRHALQIHLTSEEVESTTVTAGYFTSRTSADIHRTLSALIREVE